MQNNKRMHKAFKDTRIDYLLLFFLLAFHGIANYLWLEDDISSPVWDPCGHLIQSINYLDIIGKGNLDQIFLSSNRYPPLVYITTTPFYIFFGISEDTACMSLLLYLAILFYSVYGIGRHMFNRTTGLLSAFVVSMYPAIFGLSRQYFLDLPLTSMTALGVLVLIRNEGLKSPTKLLVVSLIFALGTLTKVQYMIFLSGPLIMLFLNELAKERKNWKTILKTSAEISLGIILLTLIFSIWLIPHLGYNTHLIDLSLFLLSGDWLPLIFSDAVFHYLFALIYQTTFFLFLFFIPGLFFLVKSKNKNQFYILLSWIILPYLVFTIVMRDFRYTMPFLPAVALVSTCWISYIKREQIKRTFIISLFCIALAQYMLLSFETDAGIYKNVIWVSSPVSFPDVSNRPLRGNAWMTPNSSYYNNKAQYEVYFSSCANPITLTAPPSKEDWKIYQILDYINRTKRTDNASVFVVPNHVSFNADSLQYYNKLKGMTMVIRWVTCPTDLTGLLKEDYVLVKTGYNGFHNGECSTQSQMECRRNLTETLMRMESFSQSFKKTSEYLLPDGTSAELYQKI